MYYEPSLIILSQESAWPMQTAIIMIMCNLLTIMIGRYAIKKRSLGPSISILATEGLGLPELIATTSLGHVIGAGTIIGLKSLQIIN
uniref:Photosystem I reaction center subunit PsaK n=1 Tax=Platysiphonia delicata TaxID=2006979 RepID=A0A1Z1M1A5_9FLOR|nr:photosystem I reaction center subunit X [Platysiphonia delicata]ARW59543.1 photosystem I reaction center subunit X [Platysiphonia delicata]